MSFFNNLSTLFGPDKKPKASAQKPVINKKIVGPEPVPLKPKKNALEAASEIKKNQDLGKAVRQVVAQSDVEASAVFAEAKAKAREIIVEAKDEALAIRAEAEQKSREVTRKLEEQQRNLDNQLSKIDMRLSKIEEKEEKLDEQRNNLDRLRSDLNDQREQVLKKLEEVANLTVEEARAQLFEDLETRLRKDMAQLIRQREEEAKQEADERVQEILIDAMKHGATDYVAEYTVSSVSLPSEEIKGKIIGKAGRNIHAFEKITGVDVDLDADPTSVRLSCFDPVRREIARISLERLVKDGRIQPTRIEEIVDKVRSELDRIMFDAGKQLCHDVGVYNLPNELMRMLGKFKYRFSYGQNLIAHTLEETRIGIKIAHELGIDVNTVKLGCLLHDIGKVSEETEGSHVELGVKIAKKFGLPQAVIDCIAQHHEDEPFSGPEQMAVYIADAISGARPGARYENYDEYVKRLEQLENIGNSYDEVKETYAIQAGREIRVLLEPQASKDADVEVLANKIRDEIKEKVTYPGTVTVTVIRETRSQAVAK